MKSGAIVLFAFTALAAASASPPSREPSARSIRATYVATIEKVPAGTERLELWVPLPTDTEFQRIRNLKIDSPYPWSVRREREHGNSYLYLSAIQPRTGRCEIRVSFDAERAEVLRPALTLASRREPRPEDLSRYLQPNRLVTLSPRVRDLARRITWGQSTAEGKAHAIYDWLVNTMIYDKTMPGWGMGDTERACDVQKGNCTDFHSLFISLARAEGIPAPWDATCDSIRRPAPSRSTTSSIRTPRRTALLSRRYRSSSSTAICRPARSRRRSSRPARSSFPDGLPGEFRAVALIARPAGSESSRRGDRSPSPPPA